MNADNRMGSTVVWPNHNGEQASGSDIYFGDPGEWIGRITSASTNLDSTPPGKTVFWGLVGRLFLAALAAGAAALVGWGLAELAANIVPSVERLVALGAGGFGFVGFVAGFLLAAPTRHSTYVGTDGVARATRKQEKTTLEAVRWDQVRCMTFNQTRNYTNGVYTGTSFRFTFHRTDGEKPFVIHGSYSAKEAAAAPRSSLIHFAFNAESSWTTRRLNQMESELASHGSIHFGINKKDWIQVGEGFIELFFKGERERVEAADLTSVALDQGYMTIQRTGSRKGLFSSEGVFRFNVNGMADFRYFIIVFQSLTGYRLA